MKLGGHAVAQLPVRQFGLSEALTNSFFCQITVSLLRVVSNKAPASFQSCDAGCATSTESIQNSVTPEGVELN